MKITEFGTTAQFTQTFDLRGRTITLRALSGSESQRLERIDIRPQPPLIVKPGSHPENGPAVPYEFDPRYRQDHVAWYRRHRCREVAAAAGLTGSSGVAYAPGMSDEQLKAWSTDITPLMLDTFTDEEIAAAHAVVQRLGDPLTPAKVDEALKN